MFKTASSPFLRTVAAASATSVAVVSLFIFPPFFGKIFHLISYNKVAYLMTSRDSTCRLLAAKAPPKK
jgi:hypothetical protein